MPRAILDSIALFARESRSLPQHLILFVTSRCNARCEFCLYYDSVMNPVAAADELRCDEVSAIADQYGPLHYLALSGGEPFVRDDLGAICQAFIDSCGTRVIDIPSNFYYTESMLATLEPMVRKNPSVVFDVQLSIDHLHELHDESRHVPGLFERALRTARQLAPLRARVKNLKLKLNVVFLPKNEDDLEAIVAEMTREVRFDRVQITYPNQLLPSHDVDATAAHVDAFVRAERAAVGPIPGSATDVYSLGLRSVKPLYHRRLSEAAQGRRPVGNYCEAGRRIVVINEKGDVFPCEPLWHPIGNLRDEGYDLRKILAGPAYEQFRARFLGNGRCNCSWGCAIQADIVAHPRYFPEIGLNAVRALVADGVRSASRAG